ncbi:MAG: type II toxin-antitoxin system VapC family toxin [Bacteroidota bacterium]|nr:type II toxin-antitoxin system VapC family toxin [Bacteroidota bacterium]
MNGDKIILDTNIVLYLLGGKLDPDRLPDGKYAISFITELELLSYPKLTKSEETQIHNFLNEIEIIDITPDIKKFAIRFRKKYSLKLPDAIICGTVQSKHSKLVTQDMTLRKVKEVQILIRK